MKKLIIICEILILFIILAKIIAIGGIIKNSDLVDFFLPVRTAAANPKPASDSVQSTTASVSVQRAKGVFEGSLSEERKLLSLLVKRQKAFEDRKNFLKSEEKRLNSIKDDILSKIDRLSEIEGRVTILLKTLKEMNNKKYKDLAKVYESTPPDLAGPMLEKLDNKTAAAIIMNMKGKKAGAIWGYIKPSKAVEITGEIIKSDENQK